jgi:hypothetical protein
MLISEKPTNPVASVTAENILRFNRNNRNLLGVLQLVAKLLEIWFVIIAGALLFLITVRLASRPSGLPLGFLTRTCDMPGVREVSYQQHFLSEAYTNLLPHRYQLVDPLLWRSGGKGTRSPAGRKVWFLILFSMVLALLCNLMG